MDVELTLERYAAASAAAAPALYALRNRTWDGQWAEAEAEASRLMNEGAHSATVAMYFAEVAVLRALTSELPADEATAVARLDAVDTLVTSVRALVSRSLMSSLKGMFKTRPVEPPERVALKRLVTVELDLCEAFATALAAAMQLKDGAWLKGAYKLRRAWKLAEGCTETVPLEPAGDEQLTVFVGELRVDFSHLRSGLCLLKGFFHYAFGRAPPSLGWLLSIAGCAGDVPRGLAELELCAAGGLESVTARYLLSLVYSFTGETDEAVERGLVLTRELSSEHPTSPVLAMGAGYVYRERGHVDDALAAFTQVTLAHATAPQLALNGNRELARTLLALGRCAEAAPLLDQFLIASSAAVWRSWVGFQRAVAASALGDATATRAALETIAAARPEPSQREFAAHSRRRAREYLERLASHANGSGDETAVGDDALLDARLVAFYLAMWASEAGQTDRGLLLLGPSLDDLWREHAPAADGDEHAAIDSTELLALLGSQQVELLRKAGRTDEATGVAERLMALGGRVTREQWALARVHCELCELALAREAVDEAAAELRTAEELADGHDFARQLGFRAQRLRQRIVKLRARA